MNTPNQRLLGSLSILNVVLALAAGSLHALSMAWPRFPGWSIPGLAVGQPVWWLELVSLATLAWLLRRCVRRPLANWRAGLLYGGLFACAWLTLAFGWTFVAMHTYGGLPAQRSYPANDSGTLRMATQSRAASGAS